MVEIPQNQRTVLIVDPDISFLGSLQSDPKASHIPPLVARTGKDAQLIIADKNKAFGAIFVNLCVTTPGDGPGGISVIRFAHQHRPATPIFVIYDGSPTLTPEELKHLAIHRAMAKPITYTEMIEIIGPQIFFFNPDMMLEGTKRSTDTVDTEMHEEDSTFLAIRAADFLAGSKSFFDVYVRLAMGKYIKILQAGDHFSAERVSNYIKKGVTHFYLRKEAQQNYLTYCDQITTRLLQTQKAPIHIKMTQTLNHGQETLSFLKHQGLSDSHLQYASSFMRNVQVLIRQLDLTQVDTLQSFWSDLTSYEHGISTAMIASLLAKQFGIHTDRPVQIVGISSMLHDIGLQSMSVELHDEDESKMTSKQKELYYTHPLVGASILKNIRTIDPAVVQAVIQHHERRSKKGFPAKIGAGAINRIAEIVGISDEFVRLIKTLNQNKNINPLDEAEKKIFDGFSQPVVEAFKKIFFPQSHY